MIRKAYGKHNDCLIQALGTGIGVSVLINGEFYQGTSGLVEGGHMIIDCSLDARLCGCGQRGCAEAYASASSTVRRYREASGDPSRSLGAVDVFRKAVEEGDAVALAVIDEVSSAQSISFCRMPLFYFFPMFRL
jgi:glucokinase